MKIGTLVTLMLLLLGAAPAGAQTLDDAARMVEAGRYAEAKPLLLRLTAREPDNARAAYWCGRALLGLNEADGAVRCLERAVQLEPGQSLHHMWLGRAYGTQAASANMLKQAQLARRIKAAFERAVALDPANLDARASLIDFHLIAPGMMGGDRRRALAEAQEIHRRNPYRGLQELVRVHGAMEDHAAADDAVATLLRSYPDSTTMRITAAAYYQGRGRFEDAYEVVAPLAARTPPHPAALYQVGRIGALSGRELERAEAALRRYLSLQPGPDDPSYAAAHWRLGMIEEHRGNRAAARQAYETALRLDPNFTQAREALRKLR